MIDGPGVDGVVDQGSDGSHDGGEDVSEAYEGVSCGDMVGGGSILGKEEVYAEGLDGWQCARSKEEEECTCERQEVAKQTQGKLPLNISPSNLE